MTEPLQTQQVRELVGQTLAEFGVSPEQLEHCKDTILIQDGHYCGRSFRVDGYLAMWMVEIGLLQFYDRDGALLKTITLSRQQPSHPRAA